MNKTIYATQNEDGTYRVMIKTIHPEKEEYKGDRKYITNSESETIIPKADIHLVVYAEKNDNKLLSLVTKE